jgi:hypothetical protein
MIKSKPYYQLIPDKVYQSFSIIEDLIRPDIKGYSSDNLKEVISIVSCHIRKNDGTSQLQMTYLRKLVAQGDRYLLALIDLNIIQRIGKAIKGQSSYQYRFAPEYQSRFKSIPLRNAKVILRIERAQKQIKYNISKSMRKRIEQIKYLKLLTIDPTYKDFFESNFSISYDQYNSIIGSATRIMNGDIFYTIDSTSGRFHSNITNMAKVLRPFLRINNEPLVNLDIKNSQPYLSTILLTNPGKVSWMTKDPAFAMLLQTLKVSLSQDVRKYITLVISGQIYEYLMTEFLKQDLELNRNDTKRQMLRILFARNRSPKDEINRKARQIFKNCFPTVHRIFSKIRGTEKGNKFQNFKRFAILLQTIESYLVLDVILKRIYKELPGTIAITIHDSIMTGVLTNNVSEVNKIMVEELTKFVGFAPKLSIEGIIREKERESKERIFTN